MKNHLKLLYLRGVITLFLLLSFATMSALPNINYIISMPKPHTHYLEIEMKVTGLDKEYIDLILPSWTPGSYLIREYAQYLQEFKAFDKEGHEIKFEKLNKNKWRVFSQDKKEISVFYKIYAFKRSVHHNFLDDEHAFITGANTFMYIDGMLQLPSEITINPYKEFKKVSTGLSNISNSKWTFFAENYDQLVDCPFEIGNQEVLEFEANGIPHEIAIYGIGNHDSNKLIKDFKKIVETCTEIFGENPNKKYTFIIHNEEKTANALEHMNSTVIDAYRWGYKDSGSYKGFLSTVTHEYFHLWNVKRLRPIELGPFNYEKENHSKLLWVVEGFTNYFTSKILYKAGLDDLNEFLGDDSVNGLASGIYYSEDQPGIRVQSASDGSFNAWIKHYRRNEDSHNSIISYYNKGMLLGLVLDLEIINGSKAKHNLDDVMKYLYKEYYKKQNRGFTEVEFKQALEKFAGKNLDKFYADYVNGVKTIDYEQYLSYAGLKFSQKFKPEGEVALGIWSKFENGRMIIKGLDKGTSCYDGGLNAFDEIIAVNGFRVKDTNISKFYNSKPGEKVDFLISRNGQIRKFTVTLKQKEFYYRPFIKVNDTSKKQIAVYVKWLYNNEIKQSK